MVKGSFSVGDSILIAPGRRVTKGSKSQWIPIKTEIQGIKGGGLALDSIHAGGLCGISTPLDPMVTKADDLSGKSWRGRVSCRLFGKTFE